MKNRLATLVSLSSFIIIIALGGCNEGKDRGYDTAIVGSWNEVNLTYFPRYRVTFQQDGNLDFVGHGYWSSEGTTLFVTMDGESSTTEYQYKQSGDNLTLTSISGYEIRFVRSTIMADNGTFTNPPLPIVSTQTGTSGSSSSGGSTSPSTPSVSSGLWGTIYNNHGHAVQLDAGTIANGRAAWLELYPASTDGHTHQLWLSALEIQQVAAGMHFVGTSTVTEGHSHMVTFN